MKIIKPTILILALIAISACGSNDIQSRNPEPDSGIYESAELPITEPISGVNEADEYSIVQNRITDSFMVSWCASA